MTPRTKAVMKAVNIFEGGLRSTAEAIAAYREAAQADRQEAALEATGLQGPWVTVTAEQVLAAERQIVEVVEAVGVDPMPEQQGPEAA